MTTIAEARALFSPEGHYLNTATYGLPPRPAYEAFLGAADEWRHGRTGFDGWDQSVGRARRAWARLVGVPPERVAVGAHVSPFVGLVAAAVPAGRRVVVHRDDFTSLLFPFLAQRDRGVDVRLVALDEIADAVDADTHVVAVSSVQSADGRLADLDAIADAAAAHDARTIVDATQGVGWHPFDATRHDLVVAGTYKWQLSPRGGALAAVSDRLLAELTPHAAGWYAGEDPDTSYYGPPLRLAADARRLDTSPGWHAWVGTAPALELLADIGHPALHAHATRLADGFRAGLDLPPAGSAIVAVDGPADAVERLAAHRIRAAARAGRVRLSFHLYNDEEDVAAALAALAGVSRPSA